MHDFTYNKSKKIKTKLKCRDTENRVVVARGRGGWGMGVVEMDEGNQRYKPPVIKKSHRDVKYSMGNTVHILH